MPYKYPTFTSSNLLSEFEQAAAGHLVIPGISRNGDIIGVCVHIKLSGEYYIYSLAHHIDEFIVMGDNDTPVIQQWKDLEESKKANAAILAMKINGVKVEDNKSIHKILSNENSDGNDHYVRILILPSLILVQAEMHEGSMVINPEYEEENQQEIDSNFSVIKATPQSSHQAVSQISIEVRDLKYLHILAPIREDLTGDRSPPLKPSLMSEPEEL